MYVQVTVTTTVTDNVGHEVASATSRANVSIGDNLALLDDEMQRVARVHGLHATEASAAGAAAALKGPR